MDQIKLNCALGATLIALMGAIACSDDDNTSRPDASNGTGGTTGGGDGSGGGGAVPAGGSSTGTGGGGSSVPCTATDDETGHEYEAFSTPTLDWNQAKTQCESWGGYLATIVSPEENAIVAQVARCIEGNAVWIGLSDQTEEGKFEWVIDEKCPAANPESPQPDIDCEGFAAWGGKEPNDGDGNGPENCAAMYFDIGSTWNDEACGVTRAYVCEKGDPLEGPSFGGEGGAANNGGAGGGQ